MATGNINVLEKLREIKTSAEALDECSFEEEMQALGVEVIKTPKPKNKRKWYPPDRRSKSYDISVSKTTITLSAAVVEALGGSGYAVPGIECVDGKTALILKPTTKSKGYKMVTCKPGLPTRRFANARLVARMVADGLKYGHYRAEIVKGGVVAWLSKAK